MQNTVKDRKLLNIELGRVTPEEYRMLPESGRVVVLDNIRSVYNVGSAFRTCDAFRVDKIYLCGICALPPSAEIRKTALGAEESVAWEHYEDTLSAVRELRSQGYTVVSVEQTVHSVPLDTFRPDSWDSSRGTGKNMLWCSATKSTVSDRGRGRFRLFAGNPAVRHQAFSECCCEHRSRALAFFG